jgi:hypothetical protein
LIDNREHLPSAKMKMSISTGYKKSTNLQPKWPRMSMISEEVRISIIRRPELQQGNTATHMLESQGQA